MSDIEAEHTCGRRRIGVLVTHLSHYRQAVYEILQESPDYDFSFYGEVGAHQGIEGVDERGLDNVRHIPFRRFGPIVWQSGAIRLAFRKDLDGLIILGDVRVMSSWILAAFARMKGKKVLFWTQAWSKPDRLLQRVVRKTFYSLSEMLLIYGDTGRTLALRYGLAEDRLQIIGNSVLRYSEVESLRISPRDQRGDSLVVGVAARITSAKRIDFLLAALHELAQKGVDVRLRLVGEGAALEGLLGLAESLSIPVDALGPVYDQTKLAEFYRSIDLTVIPNEAGLTITQSMGFGVPVVVGDDPFCNGPEVDAVVNGVTGLKFAQDDLESLAKTLERYLRFTPSQRQKMSEAARREILEHWTAEYQAERITDGLDRIFEA